MASVFVAVAMVLVFYLNRTILRNGQYFYVKWQYQLFFISNSDVWMIHFQFQNWTAQNGKWEIIECVKKRIFQRIFGLRTIVFCCNCFKRRLRTEVSRKHTFFSPNAIISAVRTYATHQVMKYPVQFSFGSFFSALSHRPPHSSCRLLMIHCLVKMKNWFWSECGFALIGSLPTTVCS